jgi:hypothetical protein
MPRKLSPSGEAFLREVFGPEAEAKIKAINEWAPPPEHNHRCNEPPLGHCAELLREIFGVEEGNARAAAINADADRFAKARADRQAAQGLQFPNRSRPITPDMIDHIKAKDAERQRRRRERIRAAREAQKITDAT